MALPRFAVPLGAGMIALGSWFVHIIAEPAAPPPAAATSEAPTGTPVLSARRAPTLIARANADLALGAELDTAMGTRAGDPATCLVVRRRNQTIFSQNPVTPLIPASNQKLVTAFTALSVVPPDTTYVTELRTTSEIRDGRITGDVWAVGSGDPLLSTDAVGSDFAFRDALPPVRTRVEDLAAAVDAAGVSSITGSIVGDESRYDTVRYIPTWKPSYAAQGEVGPQSALTVNRNFATWETRRPSENPAALGAEIITSQLNASGIQVGGTPVAGAAPSDATTVIASVTSPPFADIVGDTLRDSDNLAAELILKETAVRSGLDGTTANGAAIASETLSRLGIDTSGTVVVDGSGLDRGNRQTCASLVVLLEVAALRTPSLLDGLPVAGTTGTLADRMQGSTVKGKIKAKTGALSGVTALSGVATTTDAESIQFSMIANELSSDSAGRELQESVARRLVGYPGPLPVARLAPIGSVAAQEDSP